MLLSVWLFIGVIAIGATAIALSTQSEGARLWPNDDAVAIISGVVGFSAWGVWTYGSLNIEVAGDAVVYTFSSPAITYFGIALSLIPGYIALTGPVNIVRRARETDATDV